MGMETWQNHKDLISMRWSCKIDANAAIGIIGRQGGWDKEVVLRKVQSGDNMADIGTKVLERDTIQEHVEKSGMCPLRPGESGDSWSSWGVHGHRHIHISAELPSVQSIQTLRKGRKNPFASRAGQGTPTPFQL